MQPRYKDQLRLKRTEVGSGHVTNGRVSSSGNAVTSRYHIVLEGQSLSIHLIISFPSFLQMAQEPSLLFTPLKVGNVVLKHRVVMAPLTRFRATKKSHVPLDYVKTYYSQRSSVPGTLIITEGTFIAPHTGGFDSAPGIWN